MDRLRQAGDSDYDVLGVSPEASDEEINAAFRRLTEEGGYRSGVPLSDRWARAREIRAAYERLADPERRRVYDETLRSSADGPLWRTQSQDAATDGLVRDEPRAAQSEREAMMPAAAAAGTSAAGAAALFDAPIGQPPADIPRHDPVGPSGEEHAPPVEDAALGEEEEAPRRRSTVMNLALGSAVMVGLGGLLLAAWPSADQQPPSVRETASALGDAGRPGAVAPDAGEGAASPAADATAPGVAEEMNAFDPGTSGAIAGLGAPFAAPTALGSGEAAAEVPSADSSTPADAQPGTSSPAPQPAPAQSGASPAAPPTATPQPAVASSPPAAAAAPTVSGAVSGAARTGSVVSAPTFLGGGPTNADNRRGRLRGTVVVQFTVGPDGRVSNCAPVRGSGNPQLDARTCQLLQQRARFAPGLDAQGRPVESQAYGTYVWGRGRRN